MVLQKLAERGAGHQAVEHFLLRLAITTPAELRQSDHKAVIAWERDMRETETAAASTVRGGFWPCRVSTSTSPVTGTRRAIRTRRTIG